MSPLSLPQYKRPPVVETVLGIQFEPISQLTSGMIGKYWATMDATEWPVSRDAEPIQSQMEEFGGLAIPLAQSLRIQMQPRVYTRVQIESHNKNRLIQIQRNRFHYNWKRAGGSYPNYGPLRDEFSNQWTNFLAFLEVHGLERPQINQWEVTYLNHIPRETVWNTPSDWTFFKLMNAIVPDGEGAQLESFGGEWHFRIPQDKGRLHIRWSHTLATDQKEMIVLNLTARGPVKSSDADAVVAGLDCGREQIVNAFQSLMSDRANAYWGLSE